ncbi:MAG: hypothetical protein NVS3B20_27730 [Polyangiales bacterium]
MRNPLVKAFLDYHHRTSRIPHGKRVTKSLVRQLGRVDSLMDIGCGDGVNTRLIAVGSGAKRVAGVDVVRRENTAMEVKLFDGTHVPFEDKSFDAVTLVDVLHHCEEPQTVLNEAVRVAKRCVVVKDHFTFGPISSKILYWSDLVGNAKDAIPCPDTYVSPKEWIDMVTRAGGRVVSLDWPLKLHDLPWRIVGWPELQFTMRIEPA